MNSKSTNGSKFRYGHFVLEKIESSHVQEVYLSTSLNESSLEFDFETD